MEKLEVLPANASHKQRDAALEFLGWKPEDWQRVEMHRMRDAREYGCNVGRQNGKSYNNGWRAIELSIFHSMSGGITVHNDTLRRKLLREMEQNLEKAQKMGLVKKILRGDDSTIEFSNGAILAIRIRNKGFITGLTLDYLIHDEAQKMSDAIIAEARPVLRRSKLGAVAYVGTPQTEDDYKDHGRNRFTRMLEDGEMGPSNRAAFPELSDELLAMDKIPWKELQKSNPAWRTMANYKLDMKTAWETESREDFWNFYGAVPKRRSDEVKRKPPRFSLKEVEGFLTKKGSVGTQFYLSIGITADSDVAYAAMNDGSRTEIGHRWEIPYGELHAMAEDIRAAARSFSQIRITATPRGKALAEMLKERQLGSKIKLMGMPETSSNLNLMISQLKEGKLKIVDADSKGETKTALSGFWMEINARSGGAVPVSGLKTEEILITALANSTLDDKTAERMRKRQRFAPQTDGGQKAPAQRQRTYAW